MNKNKDRPEWFNGIIYDDGDDVTNPLSGESCFLNNVELSIFDFIIGSKTLELSPSRELNDAIDWFKQNNPKAYMILLD